MREGTLPDEIVPDDGRIDADSEEAIHGSGGEELHTSADDQLDTEQALHG